MNQDLFDATLTPGSIKSAMKESGSGSRDLWQVPIENIRTIDNFNVRTHGPAYSAHIRDLANSMLNEGYYQHKPLAGYVAKEDNEQIIYITDGHSRLDAAKLAISEGAEIELLPVVVSQAGVSMEDLTIALVRGNSGKPLSPYEMGVVCKRLVRFGMDISVIADRIGISSQYVNNLLSLMAAPAEIRMMVIEESVSASVAIEVIAQHGDKALQKLQEAQGRAKETGKAKVTPKHIDPANEFKKAVKKESEGMFLLLERIKNEFDSNPGEFGIADELRICLDETIARIKQSQP